MYVFNSTIKGIENADVCILIGTNPRHEAPLINARLRKRYVKGNITYYGIGVPHIDMTYPVHHLGDTRDSVRDIASGTHDVFKVLATAKNPMIILGESCFDHADADADDMLGVVRQLMERIPASITPEWCGYNVLHTAAGRVGALDVGFTPVNDGLATRDIIKAAHSGRIRFLYIHGADEIDIENIPKDVCVVYQGHHGDKSAHRADVILPGAAYTEKDATYVNTEGRVQRAYAAVSPPNQAKEDWKIIRALSQKLGICLSFNTLDGLRHQLEGEFPHFAHCGRIHPCAFSLASLPTETPTQASPVLTPEVRTFYMTDSISRHSKTMALCAKAQGGM
jgi:NADH-quinone oxidoreductase subunit G